MRRARLDRSPTVVILLAAAMIAIPLLENTGPAVTYAWFNDTETSEGNLFTAADFEPCDAPGPDDFGYVCHEREHAFEDISGTGTAVPLGDDQLSAVIGIGFTFVYYGGGMANVRISSNGFVTFTTSGSGCCNPPPIPDTSNPDGIVAGYWTDLDPTLGGTIHFERKGAEPERRLIVQFTDVPHYNGQGPVTFQVVLLEDENRIFVSYDDATAVGVRNHASGIENLDGTDGLQLRHGQFSMVARTFAFVPPESMAMDGMRDLLVLQDPGSLLEPRKPLPDALLPPSGQPLGDIGLVSAAPPNPSPLGDALPDAPADLVAAGGIALASAVEEIAART